MRTSLPFALLAALAVANPNASTAAPRKKNPGAGKSAPACGAKIFPLAAGSTWTYNPVAAPAAAIDAIARISPQQPKQIVVTVTDIEKKGKDTVISIEEKHGFAIDDPKSESPKIVETTVKGTIVCDGKNKFDISPELFWFAGEPGGVHGLTFDSFERKKETSLKLTKGTIGEAEWIEEIAAHFTRQATEGSGAKLAAGKLELERKFTPQVPEKIITKMGNYTAEKLGVIQSGRVTFDTVLSPNGKPCTVMQMDPEKKTEVKVPSTHCELPANWISTIWLAEGVGVVQTLNSYAHMYQLVDAQLK